MLRMKEYIIPDSLEEAYELNQKKGSVLLGGMLWLNQQNKSIATAIDLSRLPLHGITETPQEFQIGAMVSLRELEQHSGLSKHTNGALKDSLKSIVGVQFRNSATVGGSIFPRFGFSDVLTVFMAMDTQVELYRAGKMPLAEFVNRDVKGDILAGLIVKKEPLRMKYISQRNAATDFPTLTCAVAASERDMKCVIGARPHRAVCFRDQAGLLGSGITQSSAAAFAEYVQEQLVTGSNLRGGAKYRKQIAGVLIRRALLGLEG